MTSPRPEWTPLLTDLLLYVTDHCNLKCRHCYYDPAPADARRVFEDEVSLDQIRSAVDELVPFGLRTCKLSGGEPFVRTDIIEICRHLDGRNVRVVIETNGTLVTDDEIGALSQLRIRPCVAVSIDGARAETHDWFRGVAGSFEKAFRAVEGLVRSGIPNQVIASLFAENRGEFPELVRRCADMGVSSFKMQPVKPVGRGKTVGRFDPLEILDMDRKLSSLARGLGMKYGSAIPMALLDVGNLVANGAFDGRCSICSTLGILGDRTITLCGMGRYLEEFRFGKVGEVSLSKVWVEHPVLAHVRRAIPQNLTGICGRCIFRSQCLGYCRLFSEDSGLSRLCSPYWLCAEMEASGLFPEGRIVDRSPSASPVAAAEG